MLELSMGSLANEKRRVCWDDDAFCLSFMKNFNTVRNIKGHFNNTSVMFSVNNGIDKPRIIIL